MSGAASSDTVTGRKRRCGWFDACLVRQAVKVYGIDGIALTKLDVLDGFENQGLCRLRSTASASTACRRAARKARRAGLRGLRGLVAVTRGARSWADLPAQAVKYVREIEELIECP